jgi:hypothetical protein
MACLSWALRHGEVSGHWEDMERQGRTDLPELWTKRPRPFADAAWILSAFMQLSAGRPYTLTGTPLPITFGDMMAWLDLHEVTARHRRAAFIEVVQALDAVFRKERSATAGKKE